MNANEVLTAAADVTSETKPAHIWETVVCSRCGGCGQFGPRCVNAGRCFKCGGSGRVFTKRGAEARRYFLALSSTTLAGLQVGDRVMNAGVEAGGVVFARAGWQKIEALTDNRVERDGGHIFRVEADAEKIAAARERGDVVEDWRPGQEDEPKVIVYGGMNVRTGGVFYTGVRADRAFRVADPETTVARMKAAAEYQAALTKAGKPRKGTRYAE